jgi:hypothetical protein
MYQLQRPLSGDYREQEETFHGIRATNVYKITDISLQRRSRKICEWFAAIH